MLVWFPLLFGLMRDAVAEDVLTTAVPVLFVSQGESPRGAVGSVMISVFDRHDSAMLKVSITEDVPSGVGDQMRAAVWMAATTVALERGEPFTGRKIDVEISGRVDGPSAGGALTLALAGLLEGHRFPDDLAFTGTILPDGTVGRVGGVALKLQAAAAAGKRRVLFPSSLRLDRDLVTGEQIDLLQLCSQLGLVCTPVSHVREAWDVAFGNHKSSGGAAELKLPPEVEQRLAEVWRLGRSRYEASPTSIPMAKKAYESSLAAYNVGNIPHSWSEMWLAESLGRGMAHLEALGSHLEGQDPSVVAARLSASSTELLSRFQTALDGVLTSTTVQAAPGSAVWAGSLSEALRISCLAGEIHGDDAQASMVRLALAAASVEYLRLNEEYLPAELELEAALTLTRGIASVESLLYTAFRATSDGWMSRVVAPWAAEMGFGADAWLAQAKGESLDLLSTWCEQPVAEYLHARVAGREDFAAATGALSHAQGLATMTTALYAQELDVVVGADGARQYKNTTLLRQLLDGSRAEAAGAIMRCNAQGLPCLPEAIAVLDADADRDNPEEDRLEVLAAYVAAGLRAKAIMLMFRPA
jgi:hypothetical protein